MNAIVGMILSLIVRIPGIDWLAEIFVRRSKAEALQLSGAQRMKLFAMVFGHLGVPEVAAAAISDALANGLVIVTGIAPNGRPFSMALASSQLGNADRIRVYEEIDRELPGWKARHIDVPGR